ncbi:MAG: glutamine--fructose-6-phosphate transaminase (isomerizing) [Bacteriovoracaceae bacterium]|nr:glutamine--fructose-6-phosphate transaminase (isomerizing) [Bacteriovoracaceae bacterium]
MCGIVGHITTSKNVADTILSGLKRLEYRGYDSAGISMQDSKGDLFLFKQAGKLDVLASTLKKEKPSSDIGIGHTRWATHGMVTDNNAHPHMNEKVALVHNGIIENAEELKKNLIKKGYSFVTETDSEVFLVLLTSLLDEGKNILQAVGEAFQKVTGNSAFVIMPRKEKKIIAVKRGAPLVCGTSNDKNGKKELFVSSDAYALVEYTTDIYFPEDNVICYLEKNAQTEIFEFYELDGKTKSKKYLTQKQEMNLEQSDKGPFDHFMLKEIHEQPKLVRDFLFHYLQGEGFQRLKEIKKISAQRIYLIACGTAWHAGLVIRNFLEQQTSITCFVELASEFRYRNPHLQTSDLAIFISQSGETADTLAAQELCRSKGVTTLAFVNVENSTLYRHADHKLLTKAGQEIGVASTKAFTLQALTGYLFSHIFEHTADFDFLQKELTHLSSAMDDVLRMAPKIKEVAQEIYNYKGFIFTGRGIYFPIALEGALKLKEIAYVHAEGYASGELKHGPIALIDEQMVNIALVGPELFDKTMSNVSEVKVRRGIIVIIGDKEHEEEFKKIGHYYLPINLEGVTATRPLLLNMVNQLLSYYMAKFKGTDIDKPRNLAKSVTVE